MLAISNTIITKIKVAKWGTPKKYLKLICSFFWPLCVTQFLQLYFSIQFVQSWYVVGFSLVFFTNSSLLILEMFKMTVISIQSLCVFMFTKWISFEIFKKLHLIFLLSLPPCLVWIFICGRFIFSVLHKLFFVNFRNV